MGESSQSFVPEVWCVARYFYNRAAARRFQHFNSHCIDSPAGPVYVMPDGELIRHQLRERSAEMLLLVDIIDAVISKGWRVQMDTAKECLNLFANCDPHEAAVTLAGLGMDLQDVVILTPAEVVQEIAEQPVPWGENPSPEAPRFPSLQPSEN